MKKILVICSNSNVALQMKVHSLRKFNYEYYFLVEKNIYAKEVIKIIQTFKNKKIFYYKFSEKPLFFYLTKFYQYYEIKKKNLYIQEKFKKSNILKKIKKLTFLEVWFSNENLSKVILYQKDYLKIYFSHSVNDFLINQNHLSFFYFIKKSLEDFINNRFLYIFKPSAFNTQFYSVFKNYIRKNYIKNVNQKLFKKIFYRNLKVKKNVRFLRQNIKLINISIPYSYYEKLYPQKILIEYFKFFKNDILLNIINDKDYVYVFKFKNVIPRNIQVNLIKNLKNHFHEYKIILFVKKNTGTDSLEQFVCAYNVVEYYSNFSSSLFLIKLLKKKVKLFNFSNKIILYWKNKKKYLFQIHKKNQINLSKSIKFYKKIWIDF